MEAYCLNKSRIEQFEAYLRDEEKSTHTIEKYLRDVKAFYEYCGDLVTKEKVIGYKRQLIEKGYAVRSINSMLASLNSLFLFLGWDSLKVKMLKLQQQTFCSRERELSREEYEKLCRAAERKMNTRLSLLLQTLSATGIRISELPFITAEAVYAGKATVSLKGKTRNIFIVKMLQKKLIRYFVIFNITSVRLAAL